MAFKASEAMMGRLEETARRYERITQELSRPEVVGNRKEFEKLSREHSSLEEIVTSYRKFASDIEAYEQARGMLDTEKDPELRELAQADVTELEPSLGKQEMDLKKLLLPRDPNDEKNVIIEVRAGVGGDEAGLFAGDLFRAYQRFAEGLGCRVEPMSFSENPSGGVKEVIALISGEAVFSRLKFESGVHRVQRVPKTEASGRVHTSTVTVAVLPEAEDVDIDINTDDLRIDVYRAQGAGGQHVNKTESAVRITHLPSGEVVTCQDEKSQHKNKAKAMKVLKTRLLEKAQSEQQSKISADRRSQVGGGFRNERIRTYNFPQGRVTDHRIGLTQHNIDDVMHGDFASIIGALHDYDQAERLKELEGGI